MNTSDRSNASDTAGPTSVYQEGPVRRFFAAWKRVEETAVLLDSAPYDRVTDRLHTLETRVAALENEAKASKNSEQATG